MHMHTCCFLLFRGIHLQGDVHCLHRAGG
jgi:hypothetical protein